MSLQLTRQSRLLFIGDSITDCGREADAEKVGHGYVRLVRDWLLARDAANCPQVINMGTSGNKIPDLLRRWDRDVIGQNPDVLSIMIGINDVWHGFYAERQGCGVEEYIAGYRN